MGLLGFWCWRGTSEITFAPGLQEEAAPGAARGGEGSQPVSWDQAGSPLLRPLLLPCEIPREPPSGSYDWEGRRHLLLENCPW